MADVKRLVIGDIQGCPQELLDLVARSGLSDADEIVAVGDVVDRGPDSPAVVEFFRTRGNACSVMGNHERKHVRAFDGQVRPALSQLIARRQFGEERFPEAIDWMRGLPRFLELPEAWVVHGFFEPGVSLASQREDVLVGVMSGEQYIHDRYRKAWWELYDGDKPLIVGHHDYSGAGKPFVYRDQVYGIDTGCCYGRALTGLLLPSFQLLSVPARQDYWTEAKRRYAHLRFVDTPDAALSWGDLEELIASLRAQAPSERLARLEGLRRRGEEALAAIHERVLSEHGRVMASLRAEVVARDSPPDEELREGKEYSSRVAGSPLREFLHLARKEKLTPEFLRRRFKRPADAIAAAARAGSGHTLS